MNLEGILRAARGDAPADLLLKNARIVNVFTQKVVSGSVAVAHGRFLGFGEYDAVERIDLDGRFLCPGFIDPHVHIESSMACVTSFVRAVLPRGTTSVVSDPHEIANVLGTEGVQYMLRSGRRQPMNLYFTLPSCVPATGMETAGAAMEGADLLALLDDPGMIALGEMMNYPGVIRADPGVLDKIDRARNRRKRVEGHAPGLSGKALNAYLSAGISSDHECTDPREAAEKLAAGMHIMIREGSGAKNLDALLPLVDHRTAHRMMWCTDDRHPRELLEEGHIDHLVRRAIAGGVDPLIALSMATLHPARYYGLGHLGAVAPGRQADLIVFSDLRAPRPEQVYHRGVLVARDGEMTAPPPAEVQAVASAMNVRAEGIDFTIPVEGSRVRVIEVVPDQITTRSRTMDVSVAGATAVADLSRDLLKLCVVERYSGSGRTGRGFVTGFGLQRGALASSVAHDSHNIISVGADDKAMAVAVGRVVEMGGGLVAAGPVDGRAIVLAELPLPIAGLMSGEPMEGVAKQMDRLLSASRDLGVIPGDPFMILSFLALPVIPELKLTDHGLVDVARFEVVPLFVE